MLARYAALASNKIQGSKSLIVDRLWFFVNDQQPTIEDLNPPPCIPPNRGGKRKTNSRAGLKPAPAFKILNRFYLESFHSQLRTHGRDDLAPTTLHLKQRRLFYMALPGRHDANRAILSVIAGIDGYFALPHSPDGFRKQLIARGG